MCIALGVVDLGIVPSLLPPIIQVINGRLYGFYTYGDNIIGHMYHTSQLSAYNHGGLNSSHPRFPQEYLPRGVHGENHHQNHPYYHYPSMPTDPIKAYNHILITTFPLIFIQ